MKASIEKCLKALLVITVVVSTPGAFGQQVVTVPAGQPVYVQSANPSIVAAAQQQQRALNTGATMNMMIGVLMLSQCMQGKPPNMMMCMIGMMALMQAAQMQNASNNTSQVLAQSAQNPQVLIQTVPAAQQTTVTSGLSALASQGYTVAPGGGGVVSPSGQVVRVTALSNPQTLASLGFSPSQVNEAGTAYSNAQSQTRAAYAQATASREPASLD